MFSKQDKEYETFEEYLKEYFPKSNKALEDEIDPYQLGANFAREVIAKYIDLASGE